MPLVEKSHIYERDQLDEYYQNTLVTHLDHFWNKTPLDEVSGCVSHHFVIFDKYLKIVENSKFVLLINIVPYLIKHIVFSKKKTLFVFTTQTDITFFLFIFVDFLFINCDFCIIWTRYGVLDIGTHVKCIDDLK